MLEFRFPRERDPRRVHNDPGRHAKDPVRLDLTRLFLAGQGVDGRVLGVVAGNAWFDRVVGAADEELMH
ncbi:hypothetical protein F1880_009283 [Penicillium rolfsii]|nr:hypothetical protein F1880_009283 [Penicillium rolfsii]